MEEAGAAFVFVACPAFSGSLLRCLSHTRVLAAAEKTARTDLELKMACLYLSVREPRYAYFRDCSYLFLFQFPSHKITVRAVIGQFIIFFSSL